MLSALRLANRILSSAVLITAFSLVIYLLRRNFRSAVARAFSLLLVFVMIVYLGDAAILGMTEYRYTNGTSTRYFIMLSRPMFEFTSELTVVTR